MTRTIRARFDGRVFVPREPVEGLAVNEEVEVALPPDAERQAALARRVGELMQEGIDSGEPILLDEAGMAELRQKMMEAVERASRD